MGIGFEGSTFVMVVGFDRPGRPGLRISSKLKASNSSPKCTSIHSYFENEYYHAERLSIIPFTIWSHSAVHCCMTLMSNSSTCIFLPDTISLSQAEWRIFSLTIRHLWTTDFSTSITSRNCGKPPRDKATSRMKGCIMPSGMLTWARRYFGNSLLITWPAAAAEDIW